MEDELRFVAKKNFETARQKNEFRVETAAEEVIRTADLDDVLALTVGINSPPIVKSAEIITEQRFAEILKS